MKKYRVLKINKETKEEIIIGDFNTEDEAKVECSKIYEENGLDGKYDTKYEVID